MKTFWIIAGHASQGKGRDYDPGAVATYHGNIIKEADETRILRDLVTRHLLDGGAKVRNDESSWNYFTVCKWLSGLVSPADIAIEFHFNSAAPAAKGVEAFVPIAATPTETSIASGLCSIVSENMLSPKRQGRFQLPAGVKREDESQHHRLGFMVPKCENILLETCFISNAFEMDIYYNSRAVIAKKIAEFLLQYK